MLTENINKKAILFPLFSCLIVFSLYFIEFQPGAITVDLLDSIGHIKNQVRFCNWSSYLYEIFLYINFKIDPSLKTVTIVQMLLATFGICKLFQFVYSYSSKKLAYLVTLLILLNPSIVITTLWRHRPALFGWVFFLTIVLLYKLYKEKKWSKFETLCFLVSITILLAIRRDGIIVVIFSFFGFFKLSNLNIKYKSIILCLGLMLIIILKSLPHLSNNIDSAKHHRYWISACINQIKRIQFSKNIVFQPGDKKIFNTILVKEENIKEWFGAPGERIVLDIFKDTIPKTDLYKFYLWSLNFIIKNFPTLLKTQVEVFYDASFIDHNFHHYARWPEPKMYKIPHFRQSLWYLYNSGPRSFINIFLSGIVVTFLITFIFTIVAFIYKKSIFYLLLPIFSYNTVFFLIQPLPRDYYWYYLVILSYFIIFVIGYDLFKSRKSIICGTKANQ